MSRRSFGRIVLSAVVLAAAACDQYGPDTVPKDPGTVMVFVTNAAGAPMPGIWVYVHDLPNSVGSTFSQGRPTDDGGVARFDYISAGQRRVEVKPPAGYTTAEPTTSVDVVKGLTVAVRFTLIRN